MEHPNTLFFVIMFVINQLYIRWSGPILHSNGKSADKYLVGHFSAL